MIIGFKSDNKIGSLPCVDARTPGAKELTAGPKAPATCEDLKSLGKADVVLMPIGGDFTMDHGDAAGFLATTQGRPIAANPMTAGRQAEFLGAEPAGGPQTRMYWYRYANWHYSQ